jgi:phosphate starvation-inducible PhoH-like protein
MASATSIQHKIVVPASVPMVSLLGSADEFLRAVERRFPDTDVHVRGNRSPSVASHRTWPWSSG